MNDIATLAIPTATLCRLLQYAGTHPSDKSAGELAAVAIEEWLARANGDTAQRNCRRGYQWKSVFLPDGTQLRTFGSSGIAYAEVIGDAIDFRGESVSPHGFVCRCKGISRSAWAEIWLLLPDGNQWMRADEHRNKLARRNAPAATPAPASVAAQAVAAVTPPTQAPPKFSTVLPPIQPPATASATTAAPALPPARRARLPRVPPIPTQPRLQPDLHATVAAGRELLNAKDRRQGYWRLEDLLLD